MIFTIMTRSIQQAFINNNDGTYTMQLSIEQSVASANSGELENFDLSIFYNKNEISELDSDSYSFLLDNQISRMKTIFSF